MLHTISNPPFFLIPTKLVIKRRNSIYRGTVAKSSLKQEDAINEEEKKATLLYLPRSCYFQMETTKWIVGLHGWGGGGGGVQPE